MDGSDKAPAEAKQDKRPRPRPVWCPMQALDGKCDSGCAWRMGRRCAVAVLAAVLVCGMTEEAGADAFGI